MSECQGFSVTTKHGPVCVPTSRGHQKHMKSGPAMMDSAFTSFVDGDRLTAESQLNGVGAPTPAAKAPAKAPKDGDTSAPAEPAPAPHANFMRD